MSFTILFLIKWLKISILLYKTFQEKFINFKETNQNNILTNTFKINKHRPIKTK